MNRALQRIAVPCASVTLAAATLAACSSGGTGSGQTTAAGGVGANCTPKHQISTLHKGTITVGVTELPPWTIIKGSSLEGVEGTLLTKIAKMECLTVTIKTESGGSGIPDVQAGRVDMASGAYYRTQARAQVVNLSDPLYLDEMGLMSRSGVCTIPGLSGKQVGTIEGYLWVTDLQKLLGGELHLYQSSSAALQDLKAGRVEVDADSYGTMAYLQRTTSELKGFKACIPPPDQAVAASVKPAQTGFPITKKNPGLLAAFNADIATMHKNGTIAKLLEQYGLSGKAAQTGSPRLIGS